MLATIGTGPIEIWHSMGTIGRMVLVFLLLMSTYSIIVMIDRHLVIRKARTQSMHFVSLARERLNQHDLKGILAASAKLPGSHVARIYRAAIRDLPDFDDALSTADYEKLMTRACDREAVLVGQEMKRGLSGLASIGATAPFVGLFGTVVGIMNAFFGMASAGQAGIGAVAGGIAEALVNTAVGLFVALPAVWAYNYFLIRVEHLTVEMHNVGSELVDHFVKLGWNQDEIITRRIAN